MTLVDTKPQDFQLKYAESECKSAVRVNYACFLLNQIPFTPLLPLPTPSTYYTTRHLLFTCHMIHNPNREGKHPRSVQEREVFAYKTWICISRQRIPDTYFKSETVYFDKLIARNATVCSPMPHSLEMLFWLNTQHPSQTAPRDPAKAFSTRTEKEVTTLLGRNWKVLGTEGKPFPVILSFLLLCSSLLIFAQCNLSVKRQTLKNWHLLDEVRFWKLKENSFVSEIKMGKLSSRERIPLTLLLIYSTFLPCFPLPKKCSW